MQACVIDSNLLHVAVSVTGRLERVLEGAAVHVSFDHVTVGALKCRIHIEECLYVIFARRQFVECGERIPADGRDAVAD
jgi:hypothetical protein